PTVFHHGIDRPRKGIDVSACEQWKELLALEAAQLLEPADRRTLDVHLAAGCQECSRLLAELRETVALLPYQLPSAPPSRAARAKLLARVRDTAAATPASDVIILRGQRAARRAPWAAAAALGLAAAGFAGLWLHTRDELTVIRAAFEQRDSFYRDELQKEEKKYAILRSPNLRTVDLRGEQGGVKLDTRVFIDKDRRTWLLLSYRLPKLPPDKDYELWFFNGKKPMRAGILSQDP